MTFRNGLAGSAVVLLAVVLAVFWFHGPVRTGASATFSSEPQRVGVQAMRLPSPAGVPMQKMAPAPLPAPGTRLDLILDDLVARADAGDPGAACRLSLELLRCRRLLRVPTAVPIGLLTQAQQAEARGDERMAEYHLVESDRLGAVEATCATIDPALIDRAPQWLRAAALAGDREARLQYIDGRNLFPFNDYGYLKTPYFDTWRREAPRMLLAALAEGEPQAAIWFAEGRAHGNGAIQGLLRDDPERAQLWRVVVGRLFGGALVMPLPVAPPADARAEAVAESAARWHARWFDGEVHSLRDKPVLELLPDLDPNATSVGGGCGAPR